MDVSRLIRERIDLRDGREVVLRPIRPSDADLLIEFHGRCSPQTHYLRFFGAKPRLTRAEAEYLAGVDFDRRFAIVATAREDTEDRIVGVGRFDIVDPATAEVAVAVRDDYQHDGLGTALLERLVEIARGRGVRVFSGEVLAENEPMLGLLRGQGVEIGKPDGPVVKATISIDETPPVLGAFKIVAPFLGGLLERALTLKRRSRQSS